MTVRDDGDLTGIEVEADIGRALGLPAACFTSPAFLERELATVFARGWTLLPEPASRGEEPRPLAETLAVRGSRVPVSHLGRPLFLQRGWDDDGLRLFPNSCTHAWFPLVAGPSRSRSLTCGQHGRKFDCAGRFVSQPGFAARDAAAACHDADLPEHGLDSWEGLLFAAPGPPDEPLPTLLAPVTESLPRWPRRVVRDTSSASVREVDGNWKLHAVNYMDSFHVTWIHRAPGGLADRIDLSSYRTEIHGNASLQWAWARDAAHGFEPSLLPERFRDDTGAGRRVFALWWFVFPSTAINVYPWGISVNSWQPVPRAPERTLFAWEHFVHDRSLHERRDDVWLSAQVDAEDVDAMAQLRRGVRGAVTRTRFSPTHEIGPHWFHRRVAEAIAR